MFSYCKFLYFFPLKYFKIQKILPFCILYRKRRNGVCQIFVRYNEPDDFKTGFWYSGSESKFIKTLKNENTVDPRGRDQYDQSARSNALYTRSCLKKKYTVLGRRSFASHQRLNWVNKWLNQIIMLVTRQKHLQETQKRRNQTMANKIIVDGTVFLLWTLSETQIDAKTATKINENLKVHYYLVTIWSRTDQLAIFCFASLLQCITSLFQHYIYSNYNRLTDIYHNKENKVELGHFE